jgi:hypothetical protein
MTHLGDKPGMMACCEGLAQVAHKLGRVERAARLWGTVDMLRATTGIALETATGGDQDRQMAALPQGAPAAEWLIGRQMTLEQAVAYAGEV